MYEGSPSILIFLFLICRIFFHATGEHKVDSIVTNNLDWRMVYRGKFGQGVSFSPCPIYANSQCSRTCGEERAMLICKVLLHKSQSGCGSVWIPDEGYDTTTDTDENVYVKYYDDEFYPTHAVYYTN